MPDYERRCRRSITLAAAFLIVLFGGAGAAHAQEASGASCRQLSVPVAIGGDSAAVIHAQLCLPGGTGSPATGTPQTVQVLVPGATYSGSYWNFPYEPEKYSYVDAMLAAGYATLDLDPLGTGRSSHPLSALVTIASDADAVHQVIQDARNGDFGIRFARVLLVGHSMGTAVAWREAAAYRDIDGLIATGNVHHPSLPGAAQGVTDLYPALADPRFARAGLDPGYLTTRPGTRGAVFYNEADADPRVIALDEKTKDTATATYAATYFAEDVDADTSRITVPVLIAAGQDDRLMCVGVGGVDCSSSASLLRSEAPFYGRAACLRAFVLPRAGHDLNLSLNAASFFAEAARWANRWVGAHAPAPRHRCGR